ncbi:MAG: 2-phosphosulfolactate phosphatase [candidate division Zixibacteria bacterium]|nr:2-phosphosulfolactate phosphatase [candidate division Zixibacteria bacterium]
MNKIDLYFIPSEIQDSDLADRLVIVVDVLRASTTAAVALANGAREIIPVASIDAAGELKQKLGKEHVLLCGEREGVKIEGFDLGNSPAEYEPKVVKDKALIFCSTNGSKAMLKGGQGALCFIGGLVNLSEILRFVLREKKDVAIVCSGSAGKFSFEDAVVGGKYLADLEKKLGRELDKNDGARAALHLYRREEGDLYSALRNSFHGKYLVTLGFEADIREAARLDSVPVAPIFSGGRIVRYQPENVASQ